MEIRQDLFLVVVEVTISEHCRILHLNCIQPGMLLLIDFEKEFFYTVSKPFILAVLERYGFGPYKVKWVNILNKKFFCMWFSCFETIPGAVEKVIPRV